MDRINAELSAERSAPPSIDKENTNISNRMPIKIKQSFSRANLNELLKSQTGEQEGHEDQEIKPFFEVFDNIIMKEMTKPVKKGIQSDIELLEPPGLRKCTSAGNISSKELKMHYESERSRPCDYHNSELVKPLDKFTLKRKSELFSEMLKGRFELNLNYNLPMKE